VLQMDYPNGTIVMKEKGHERRVEIKNGQVWDNKVKQDGKPTYHVIYGEFEKLGKTIVRFKRGSGKSKHGKARRVEKLFGHEGVCHSWYKNGAATGKNASQSVKD
jgi:hypothetical protein